MILSVSRRTDIPALYPAWFFNRLREGFALVRNPMNFHQVGKILLCPSLIDCIVFWTKDPRRMLPYLEALRGYNFYFQITLTGYDRHIERNVPDKDQIAAAVCELAKKIGKERVIWRYDPIIVTDKLDADYHRREFARLAERLQGSTERCVISFVDLYRKTKRNLKDIKPLTDQAALYQVAELLSAEAKKRGLRLETCSEKIELGSLGIGHGKCIDDQLIARISGRPLAVGIDPNQRAECGCVTSLDLGAYNTCTHGCLYCYANHSARTAAENAARHNPHSPLLIGEINPEDRIVKRKMKSYFTEQLSLF